MNKLQAAIIIFLLLGSYLIYSHAQATGESFPKNLWSWFKQLGRNIKSVLGFAVIEHEWLPNQTEAVLNQTLLLHNQTENLYNQTEVN